MNTDHYRHPGRTIRISERNNTTAINGVREDIAWFEARLAAMKTSGDCAYEHALVRAYARLLNEHRQALNTLLGN